MGASSNKPTIVQATHAQGSQHINMKMVQNVLLIWLDTNINESSADCQNTITHLRRVMNTIKTFTNGDQCIEFLEGIQNEKVCMIMSGSFGKNIVPHIHDMSQVDSIFIFCGNKQYHEQWAKDWFKVKGVYTDIKLICDALKQSAKDCEQNATSFSLVATTDVDSSDMNLDRLDPMFMYTQITKEILLVIDFEHQHILDFTKYCREMLADNKQELNNVKTFERNYTKKPPIYWYTCESFLYRMLNRALRLSDMNVIVKMGFFIKDLHRHIDELHQQQFTGSNANKPFTVYRGQEMPKEELEKISNTKDGLIAFNHFLSTSSDESVSTGFAKRALSDPKMVGVLFEMKIHPKESTAPFASVAEFGAYKNDEDEILFAMHTVFHIRDIQQMGENTHLFRVKLELTGDNDKDLQVLTKHIREETFPDEEGWGRLALVLRKLGKPKQAEEIYQILLEQESDESKTGYLYCRLGLCKDDQAEYEEAILLYQKSITIDEKYHRNSSDLAKSYGNIGLVYYNMGEYAKALSYYEKTLAIQQQSLPANHRDLAKSYGNIGLVCKNMGKYAKALSYYEKTLAIDQQSLPANHPDLASSYNNIGNVYSNMGEYAKALSSHEKALAIREQSLPANHPDLVSSYNNIGLVYENMKNYSKAYSCFEKAVKIAAQSLLPNHPNLKTLKNNLDRVEKKEHGIE